MAALLADIEWSDPILPVARDPAWEAEVKRRGGQVFEVDRRVAPVPWIRETCLALVTYHPTYLSQRLFNIGALITAQENACRYCYGSNRAFMRIMGYSEDFIGRIERDAQLAELDDMERAFVGFVRNLARSRPRPSRADRDNLIRLTYSPLVVHEAAFVISLGCYYNRIGVLGACPPELGFERMANGWMGRVMSLFMPRMLAWQARKQQRKAGPLASAATLAQGPFGAVVATLAGTPGGAVMRAALDGALASPVLSLPVKALMFAVVARTLGCGTSEQEARELLRQQGFAQAEVDLALDALECPRLSAQESLLLSWARDTVHYQTPRIQQYTRELRTQLGDLPLLEAIGVAALANATVRLAMLIE